MPECKLEQEWNDTVVELLPRQFVLEDTTDVPDDFDPKPPGGGSRRPRPPPGSPMNRSSILVKERNQCLL